MREGSHLILFLRRNAKATLIPSGVAKHGVLCPVELPGSGISLRSLIFDFPVFLSPPRSTGPLRWSFRSADVGWKNTYIGRVHNGTPVGASPATQRIVGPPRGPMRLVSHPDSRKSDNALARTPPATTSGREIFRGNRDNATDTLQTRLKCNPPRLVAASVAHLCFCKLGRSFFPLRVLSFCILDRLCSA